MKKGLIILFCLLGIMVLGNLVFLDWQYFSKSDIAPPPVIQIQEENKIATGSCQLECQEIINEEIKQELAKLPSMAGQSSISPVVYPTTAAVNNKPKIVYIPLVTDGSVSSVDWTDIIPSEFYFNWSDYPGAKEVRFEAFLSSANDDPGYARIYDVTNKRGVDFSDLPFNKSAFTRVESGKMVVWSGNSKYTVQLRSVNATKVLIKDAKLKVLY